MPLIETFWKERGFGSWLNNNNQLQKQNAWKFDGNIHDLNRLQHLFWINLQGYELGSRENMLQGFILLWISFEVNDKEHIPMCLQLFYKIGKLGFHLCDCSLFLSPMNWNVSELNLERWMTSLQKDFIEKLIVKRVCYEVFHWKSPTKRKLLELSPIECGNDSTSLSNTEEKLFEAKQKSGTTKLYKLFNKGTT